MFDNYYPTSEQIWFMRNLLYNYRANPDKLTDEEKEAAEKLQTLIAHIEKQFFKIRLITGVLFPEEEEQKVREEGDPFMRPGPIYMGAEFYSEYGCNRLHEYLGNALGIIGGLQQGGLQGTEPDSQEVVDKANLDIQDILRKIGEKLGQEGMEFPKK